MAEPEVLSEKEGEEALEVKDQSKIVDFKDSCLDEVGKLFNDEDTSDVIIIVGDQRFYVHKAILAASSDYFHRMFYGGDWKESAVKEVPLHDIAVCQEVFEPFLRCFYTGTIKLIPDTACHILTLADKYAPKLKFKCVQALTNVIEEGTVKDVVTWFPTFYSLEDADLVGRCCNVICYNFKEASGAERWVSLSSEHLLIILKSEYIIAPNEFDIYAAIQYWVLSQKECPRDVIKELLAHVEFKSMDSEELAKVDTSPLAKDVAPDMLRQILNETCVYLVIGKINQPVAERPATTHCYTRGKDEMIYFKKSGISVTSKITPKCSDNVFVCVNRGYQTLKTIGGEYDWKLHGSQDVVDSVMKFTLSQKGSANFTGFQVNMKLVLLLKDSANVVRHIHKVATTTEFNWGQNDVIAFSMPYDGDITFFTVKYKCFYYFEIEMCK